MWSTTRPVARRTNRVGPLHGHMRNPRYFVRGIKGAMRRTDEAVGDPHGGASGATRGGFIPGRLVTEPCRAIRFPAVEVTHNTRCRAAEFLWPAGQSSCPTMQFLTTDNATVHSQDRGL